MQPRARAHDLAALTGRNDLVATIERWSGIAADGLTRMLRARELRYPQTARLSADGTDLNLEGVSIRYAGMAALGLGRLDSARQSVVLQGRPIHDLVLQNMHDAARGADPGAVALAAWAAAETGTPVCEAVVTRLARLLTSDEAVSTVDFAWGLTAALVTPELGQSRNLADLAARRLLAAQGGRGIFPHALPRESLGRGRSHVGSFADQVYPIQALARYAAATASRRALDAANRCAERLVELQGPAGQWSWHYDVRTGDVIEDYPTYSVHQHAMAPMVLLDLFEAGGTDLRAAVARGASWIEDHPETPEPLTVEPLGVIWRKVGRKERRKAVRTIRAATTAVRPGLRLNWLDTVCPPGPVDHECRPYELGWLLYAWGSSGVVHELTSRFRTGRNRDR